MPFEFPIFATWTVDFIGERCNYKATGVKLGAAAVLLHCPSPVPHYGLAPLWRTVITLTMPSVVYLIALLVVVVGGLYWLILKSASKRIAAQFAILSEALGLDLNQPQPAMGGFVRPEPSVYGTHGGREVSISVPGKGLQNTRQIETVLKVAMQEKRFAAQITASGLLGGLRQRDGRGLERWKSGDSAFDTAWDVRVAPDQPAASVFSPGMRGQIAALLKAGKGNLYIGGGVIAYAELGLIASEATRQRFEEAVRLTFELAETIEAAEGLNRE